MEQQSSEQQWNAAAPGCCSVHLIGRLLALSGGAQKRSMATPDELESLVGRKRMGRNVPVCMQYPFCIDWSSSSTTRCISTTGRASRWRELGSILRDALPYYRRLQNTCANSQVWSAMQELRNCTCNRHCTVYDF
jgi:hypothetical protein